jgi:hypothetical protein
VAGAFIAVLICITGCSGALAGNRAESSQGAAMSVAAMLAEVDDYNSKAVRREAPAAHRRAAARREAGECEEGQAADDCAVELFRDEMRSLYQVTAALDRTHDVLEVWEDVNLRALEQGDDPELSDRVCEPLGTSLQVLLSALEDSGVELRDTWRRAISSAELVCRLGFTLL